MNNNKKEQNDDKKILTIAIGIMLILIAFAGATYAYFAFSASNNNVITSAFRSKIDNKDYGNNAILSKSTALEKLNSWYSSNLSNIDNY